MVKPGLTIEQHRTVGKEFDEIYTRTLNIWQRLAPAYPINSKQFETIEKLKRDVEAMRLTMGNALFKDGHPETEMKIYIGKSSDFSRVHLDK